MVLHSLKSELIFKSELSISDFKTIVFSNNQAMPVKVIAIAGAADIVKVLARWFEKNRSALNVVPKR